MVNLLKIVLIKSLTLKLSCKATAKTTWGVREGWSLTCPLKPCISVLELSQIYMYFCTRTFFCTGIDIFSNLNIYFCTGKIYIVVLEYVLLYWNIYCCISLEGHWRNLIAWTITALIKFAVPNHPLQVSDMTKAKKRVRIFNTRV